MVFWRVQALIFDFFEFINSLVCVTRPSIPNFTSFLLQGQGEGVWQIILLVLFSRSLVANYCNVSDAISLLEGNKENEEIKRFEN